jgi:hypothetical protein
LTVMVGTVVTPVGAQSGAETAVAVTPQEQTVSAGDTVTYDIVVDTAPDGVSAYAYTISIDETTATITDVQFAGSAGASTRNLNYSADNSSVAVTAGLAEIDAGQDVSIGTVTLTGVSDGSTQVELDVTTLLNTANSEMTVSETGAGTLSVTAGEADNGTDDSTADDAAANETESEPANETSESETEPDDTDASETTESTNTSENTDTAESTNTTESTDSSESDTDGDGGGIVDSVPGFGVVAAMVSLTAMAGALRWIQ